MDSSMQSVINIKRRNLKSIINFLRETNGSTKKEIAQALSLSFATVSNLCNWIEMQGMIESSQPESGQGKTGRNPKHIRLKPRARLLAVADIHKSNQVVLRLYNLLGQVEAHTAFSYKESDMHSFAVCFAQAYTQAFTADQRDRVDGMGVAVSGIYDTETEVVVASELPLFEEQPLKQMLSRLLGLPVYVENDSNLCAFGIAQKMKTCNLVYIYIGEGLGIGIVTDGKHAKGQRGYAPEICHAPLGLLERRCQLCGSDRCMQTDLSIYGFAEKFAGQAMTLGDDVGWARFVNAFEQGDKHAAAVAHENAHILAAGISIVANLFDPEVVAIGGIPASLFHTLSRVSLTVTNQRRIVKSSPAITFAHDMDFSETLLHGTAEMAYARWFPSMYHDYSEFD